MRYIPVFTEEEVKNNNEIFAERNCLYKKKGLDHLENRELIMRLASPVGDRVLDIGTGRGITALFLARSGCQVVSVDTNKDMLKTAALNLAYDKLLERVELYEMDAYELEFEDGVFDSVFMVNAVHHMEDPDKIFSEADRVLRAGGKFVVSDLNEKGLDIIGSMHASEGRHHQDLSEGIERVVGWFRSKGYQIEVSGDMCHWIIVGEKPL